MPASPAAPPPGPVRPPGGSGVPETLAALRALPREPPRAAERAASGVWRLPGAAEAVIEALTPAGREAEREPGRDAGDAAPGGADREVRERGWAMVRVRVLEEAAAGRDWTREAAAWLERGGASWARSARLTSDLAWRTRAERRSALEFLTEEQVALTDPGTVRGRALWHLYLTTLRYDFRCRAVTALFGRLPDGALDGLDPYTESLRVFALLGRSRPQGLPAADRVLARAGTDAKVAHAVLHGLWLGEDLPGQARRMLAVLDGPAFAGGADPEARFRRAFALRKTGAYRAALTEVEAAIDALDPTEVVVHADCVRERALILAERDLRAVAEDVRGGGGAG
ncbi:hypothetical protein V1J52_02800 [Streptomyces sp. TRM 70351]|uniref:hypothetical protein n=1 Tax=Streptomyces sp. TRM 70351 TaxID=3116552 RepID=UPI002E7AFB59|nr:hypothetical protein [Streptomyces sp. TRM 70351]MEE1927119.1 hypothetical protein [Streptomyces sp. TRM 70351]